jgi:hypothetical protein
VVRLFVLVGTATRAAQGLERCGLLDPRVLATDRLDSHHSLT